MSTEKLIEVARSAQRHAYAPFSRFRVGAALETEQGTIFSGCNIENASFGATLCAERVALGSAVAAGERRFKRIVVVTDSQHPDAPCGLCRQVLIEFGPQLEVIAVAPNGEKKTWKVSELLPDRFILSTESQRA